MLTLLLVVSRVSLRQACVLDCVATWIVQHVDTQSAQQRHKEDRNTRERNLRRPCVTDLIVVSNVINLELCSRPTVRTRLQVQYKVLEGKRGYHHTLHRITSWCVWFNSHTAGGGQQTTQHPTSMHLFDVLRMVPYVYDTTRYSQRLLIMYEHEYFSRSSSW